MSLPDRASQPLESIDPGLPLGAWTEPGHKVQAHGLLGACG
jgi:hypothetical protein